MAITLTPVRAYVVGDRKKIIQDCLLDNSYPTGGYTLTPGQLGCDQGLDMVSPAQGAGGLMFYYNNATNKLQCYLPTGGGGVGTFGAPTASGANAVVPAGATAVTSTGAQPALTITQPTLNPGVGTEVPNGTNLSTVTVRIEATGKGFTVTTPSS